MKLMEIVHAKAKGKNLFHAKHDKVQKFDPFGEQKALKNRCVGMKSRFFFPRVQMLLIRLMRNKALWDLGIA